MGGTQFSAFVSQNLEKLIKHQDVSSSGMLGNQYRDEKNIEEYRLDTDRYGQIRMDTDRPIIPLNFGTINIRTFVQKFLFFA